MLFLNQISVRRDLAPFWQVGAENPKRRCYRRGRAIPPGVAQPCLFCTRRLRDRRVRTGSEAGAYINKTLYQSER